MIVWGCRSAGPRCRRARRLYHQFDPSPRSRRPGRSPGRRPHPDRRPRGRRGSAGSGARRSFVSARRRVAGRRPFRRSLRGQRDSATTGARQTSRRSLRRRRGGRPAIAAPRLGWRLWQGQPHTVPHAWSRSAAVITPMQGSDASTARPTSLHSRGLPPLISLRYKPGSPNPPPPKKVGRREPCGHVEEASMRRLPGPLEHRKPDTIEW